MTARIYTGAEAAALLAAYTTQPRVTFGDECPGGVPLCVDGRELLYTEADEDEGDWIYVDRQESEMHTAAPDLAASVAHHAAETRREQGRVSGLMLRLDDEKTKRVAAEQECARLRARVAELEALAAGPRSLTINAAACDAIDGGATAGPQHVDATGREVLP